MTSDLEQRSANERQGDRLHGRLVTCRVEELCPHPSYERHRFAVSASRLSALAESSDFPFHEPLMITRNRTIIDGYCRWEFARRQGRTTITCIEHDLTEEEALHWLLQRHRRVEGLNAFCRTLLALDLEPWLRELARLNQSVGGQRKGSSNLTEAESVDVRSQIAAAAGISVGNVTKVKQVLETACKELHDALRDGEVSIHRAWTWRGMSSKNQQRALTLYRGEKGVRKSIRHLVSKHKHNNLVAAENLGLADLTRQLCQLQGLEPESVAVAAIDVPVKGVFITKELLRALPALEEMALCDAESR